MRASSSPARRLVEEVEVSRRELKARCLALAVARIVLSLVLALSLRMWPSLWACSGSEGFVVPVATRVTTLAYVAISLALLVVTRRASAMKRLSQLSIGVDLAAVTIPVALSGGADSQLVLLYMLIIVGAAILISPITGMSAAIVSVTLLSVIYLGQMVGWIDPCVATEEGRGGVFRFVAVMSFFVLTAFLAAYLALNSSRLKLLNVEILESMNAGVLIVDLDGGIQYMNAMGAQILGIDAASVRGEPIEIVLAGEAAQAIRRTLQTGTPVSRMEVTVTTRDHRTVPAGITTSVLSDRRRRIWGVAATFSDLSEAKRIEERLRHADRMATIAHSVAGMGHELRNPLACIRGGVDLLAEIVTSDGEAGEIMKTITRETQRLSKSVESFLAMSRVNPPVLETHRFGTIWHEAESILQARFRERLDGSVRITVAEGSDDVELWADIDQIRQVLVNLVQNAIEALADAGNIEVSCRRVTVEGRDAVKRGVEMIVHDDGPGIPAGEQARIFEPFYTSKARGTGLGLATVKRIVEGHGGEVRLITTEHRGTTFRIWLPARTQQ